VARTAYRVGMRPAEAGALDIVGHCSEYSIKPIMASNHNIARSGWYKADPSRFAATLNRHAEDQSSRVWSPLAGIAMVRAKTGYDKASFDRACHRRYGRSGQHTATARCGAERIRNGTAQRTRGLAPMGPNQVLVSTVDASAIAQANNREAWNFNESGLAAALTAYGKALDPAFLSVTPGAVPPDVAESLATTLKAVASTVPNAAAANALLPKVAAALRTFQYGNQQIVTLPANPGPAAQSSSAATGTLTIGFGNNAIVPRDSLAPASFGPFNASVLVSGAAGKGSPARPSR